MAKNKKRRYGKKSAVSEERLSELRGALEDGTLAGAADEEVERLAERLAEEDAAALLVALRERSEGKKQRKAVNRALYRLERRGVEVPDWRERPKGIDLAQGAESIADLPVLFNEPYDQGSRLLVLPHQSGRLLKMIQVRFQHPTGLDQLRAVDIGRRDYRAFVKQMVRTAVIEGSAAAVTADDAFRQRKLWEIGQCIHGRRTSAEVDHDLVSELRWADEPPPHPVMAVDLEEVEPLSPAELARATRLAVPLISQGLWKRVEAEMAEARSSPLILSETTEADRVAEVQRRAVEAEVAEWHLPSLVELLLDVAYFRAQTGDLRTAKTVRDVVGGVPDDRVGPSIGRWLTSFVGHFVAEEPPSAEEPGSSGLIIP